MSEPLISIETVHLYQNVFNGNPDGRMVLQDILTELSFFDAVIETEEQRVLLNASHLLLAKLGVWHPDNAQAFTEAIMKLPARHQEATKETQDERLI